MAHMRSNQTDALGRWPAIRRGAARYGIILLLAACAGCGDDNDDSAPAMLLGRAQLDVPVQSGQLRLLDAGGTTLQEQSLTLHNGTFQVALAPQTQAAIAAGLVRVELATTHSGAAATLASDLQQFDVRRDIAVLNSVTTISAAYRDLHPAMAPDDALDDVWTFLGLPVDAANVCDALQAAADVDRMVAVSTQGGFDAVVDDLAEEVDDAAPFPLRQPTIAGVPAKLFQFTVESLAGGVLSGFTSKGLGFILSAIGGPDSTKQTLDDIKSNLAENSKQLGQISAQVDALSAQIADFKNAITDLVNLRAYEQRASTLQKEINTLCSLQARLTWLALSDPEEDHKRSTDNLRDDIESQVDPILRDLESELLGGTSFSGLISLWADINSRGTGYPNFFSNAYLKKAVPHADYFIGAQTLALYLLVEEGNYLGGSLGKNIGQSAVNRWMSAVDRERRAIAADRGMNVQSEMGYPAVILPSDDIVIPAQRGYAESVRAFTRTLVCVPGDDLYADDPNRCTVHVLPQTLSSPTVIEHLTTLQIGGVGGWNLPTARHYSFLLADRPSNQDYRAYLRDNGFDVYVPDGEFVPYFVRDDGSRGKLAIYPPTGVVAEPRNTNGAYFDLGRALAVRNVVPEWAYIPNRHP